MELFKKADFLEVGKVYADTLSDCEVTTYLKFVGGDGDRILFEYVSGEDTYCRNEDGLIGFVAECKEVYPRVFSYRALSLFFIPTDYPF